MQTRQKFKRRVIELIHGLPYEEAIGKEYPDMGNFNKLVKNHKHFFYPITIGRVMQALKNNSDGGDCINVFIGDTTFGGKTIKECVAIRYCEDEYIFWKLTKENGQEATDDNQTDETINKLYNLLK